MKETVRHRISRQIRGVWSCVGIIGLLVACGGNGPTGGRSGAGFSEVVVGTGGADATGALGSTLPISAHVFASDTISGIEAALKVDGGEEWVVTEVLSDAEGIGSTRGRVDMKMQLPPDIRPGAYAVVLTVADKQGGKQSVEHPVRLVVDASVPMVMDLEIGINAAGNDLHLAAHVMASQKVSSITATVEGSDWQKEYTFDGPQISGKIDYQFHEHAQVDAAPAGKYKVVLTVFDQKGNRAESTGFFVKR